MNAKKRNAIHGILLIMPLMIGFVLFYGYPFLLVFLQSVSVRTAESITFTGWSNLQETLAGNSFQLALGNTLKFLAVCLPLILAVSYGIAWMLYSARNKNGVLKSVLLLPYVMPVVGSVLLVELLLSQNGIANHVLITLGFQKREWLNSPAAFWAVVGLYLWKNAGYSVILLLAGLNTIPKELYEAAELDGAGAAQKFRFITTPQMWYSLYFAGVFSLINAFKCFREIFLIGGNHPNSSIYLLQHFINNVFEKMDYAKLCAASILFFAIIFVLFLTSYQFVMGREDAVR